MLLKPRRDDGVVIGHPQHAGLNSFNDLLISSSFWSFLEKGPQLEYDYTNLNYHNAHS